MHGSTKTDQGHGTRAPATAERLHASLSRTLNASHAALSDRLFRDWENASRSVGGITD
jgi:hypothetical protein